MCATHSRQVCSAQQCSEWLARNTRGRSPTQRMLREPSTPTWSPARNARGVRGTRDAAGLQLCRAGVAQGGCAGMRGLRLPATANVGGGATGHLPAAPQKWVALANKTAPQAARTSRLANALLPEPCEQAGTAVGRNKQQCAAHLQGGAPGSRRPLAPPRCGPSAGPCATRAGAENAVRP